MGLNFENPLYKDKVSTMTFGYFDMSHIEGAENGLHWFVNRGEENWSIMLNSIKYNGVDLRKGNTAPKLAHIDTAGPHIQIPMTEFKKLTSEIRKIDYTVSWEQKKGEEGPRMVTNQQCEQLYDKYSDLEFNL